VGVVVAVEVDAVSFLFRGPAFPKAGDLIPERRATRARPSAVSTDQAMRHSVVWACLRLRADLISTSPVDCYRDVDGRSVEVPAPPVLTNPGGSAVGIGEWLYSTQVDLDRFGNTFGVISARDGLGFPARIDLLAAESVTVLTSGGAITGYRVGSKVFDPIDIWHEKQFTVAGLPVGLSPLAYAALSLSTGLAAQEFAADWFAGAGIPAAHLKNTSQVLDAPTAEKVKQRYIQTVASGDVFVTGADWDFKMLGAAASESGFLEAIHASSADVCRFHGVPGDMVDVNERTGSVTYANITQRNLQLLIMNLGPAATRRERALSQLLPRRQYVKLNTDAVVLRMDPMSRAQLNALLVQSKQRTPSEVREKDDLPPFTPEQIAEIQELVPTTKALGLKEPA
jgi:HK97 family phage portal protein